MKVIYDKSYKVFFGENVLNHLAQTIINKAYSNVFVLVDENTEKHCLPILKPYLENFTLIKISSGEVYKNLSKHIHNGTIFIWRPVREHMLSALKTELSFHHTEKSPFDLSLIHI